MCSTDRHIRLAISPELDQNLARFLWRTVRDPLPDRLSWATERTDRYARRSWLVIDELEEPDEDHGVDETNRLPRWGTRIQRRGPTSARRPWGRVELERDGNHGARDNAQSEAFSTPDLARRVRPRSTDPGRVDGHIVHEARVDPSVATLLDWAARDEDRTMLFARRSRRRALRPPEPESTRPRVRRRRERRPRPRHARRPMDLGLAFGRQAPQTASSPAEWVLAARPRTLEKTHIQRVP